MNRSIVAGNWKMHGSRQFVADYVRGLERADRPAGVRLLLIPPVGYLAELVAALERSGLTDSSESAAGIELGAQNLHPEPQGAYTGEMSGEMLKDLGAGWVLVGHSERREYAAESDELVAEKAAAALRADLKPVICVGESEAEREAGTASDVVLRQLNAVLDRCGVEGLSGAAIAYEPVWAIGTGKTATPELAQVMHALIRTALADRSSRLAEQLPVLYGGSVKGANARQLFAEQDIDGGLVGGASLQVEEMLTIARSLAPEG